MWISIQKYCAIRIIDACIKYRPSLSAAAYIFKIALKHAMSDMTMVTSRLL